MIDELIGTALDKIIPDAGEREQAKLNLAKLRQDGEFKPLELKFSAIVAEAKSADPFTSRARPSFLYVMYTMILAAIPMGVLFAFAPDVSARIIEGVKGWLDAIPQELWVLFGTGYLGYVNKRSNDKATLLGQPTQQGWLSKLFG